MKRLTKADAYRTSKAMATCGEGYIDDDAADAGCLLVRGPQTIPVQILKIARKPLDPTIQTNSFPYLTCLPTPYFTLHNMATAAPLIVPALKKHTATVIWAHGLGDR